MRGDFFPKFKVFTSMSIFLYFHFVKYKSSKSISAVKSWCSFYQIVKNFFSKTSLWSYNFFFNLLGCVNFPVVKCVLRSSSYTEGDFATTYKQKRIMTVWKRTQERCEVNRCFCCSQESFIKGILFPELELIISMKTSFNPLSTLSLFILSSLCIDCIFSSSYLHFNPTCSIRSLILLGLVLEMGTFNVTGKKSFFCF